MNVRTMKEFMKLIVYCIGITLLNALPVASQSRSLEWERAYAIYNDDDKARCVIDLDFSGQKYNFNCLSYGQFKAKERFINFFPDPSGNTSGVIDVLFMLNNDLFPTELVLVVWKKGYLVGKGKLICREERSGSGFVGTSCGAHVILDDGRKVKLIATVLMKL